MQKWRLAKSVVQCVAGHTTSGPPLRRAERRSGLPQRTGGDLMPGSVIVAGARTPIGKMSGALAGFSAMDLGGFAMSAALSRAGREGSDVDYVIMGHVIRAGQGQITARQAAVKAGIPMTTPALMVDKVCLSGL